MLDPFLQKKNINYNKVRNFRYKSGDKRNAGFCQLCYCYSGILVFFKTTKKNT